MSSAFQRELDREDAIPDLPDRPVSTARNLVTPEGLIQIENEVEHWAEELKKAQAAEDKAQVATAGRELRYWTARRSNAEVVEPIADHTEVRFGHRVTVETEGGKRRTFRIVGEDQADPAKGMVPYVAPIATALLGKSVGDTVEVMHGEAEIVAID
ncbi:MAG TPA: GreA/GreB family elongation factor [Beijerinckiaceae bacterium]|jgi:transcription elongation GreA/GreB family factor|nr:GreA/GreB family elongation factor [Beijerinckiaceae bacterium]